MLAGGGWAGEENMLAGGGRAGDREVLASDVDGNGQLASHVHPRTVGRKAGQAGNLMGSKGWAGRMADC